MSPERELLASLGRHRLPALATGVLIALGIAAGFGGIAWGAVLILAGLACSALVDTRLPILLLLLLIAPLTLFHPLPAFEVAGSVIDFRLLMTGGIGLLLAVQLALLRPRWDVVGVVGICYVALLVLLVPLNEYGPLRAIAPVARFSDYVLAFLVARSVLKSPGDGRLAIGSVLLGLSIVAASGLLQFAAGPVLERDGAPRLAGLYLTSPVGLGMAMELGLIVLWVGFLRAGRWKDRTWLAAAALFAVFLFVMLETSTRLVFASLVAGLVLVELLHRRLAIAGGILIASALLLVLQPNLAGRIAATVGEPAATPAPTSPAGPPAVVEEKFPGDPSLRYRLYIWYEMLPEWAESPVLGRGTGSFAVLLERRAGIQREAPHNDYFGLLVETGLVGLGAYLLLQLTILAAAVTRWRLARLASSRALLATAGIAYFAMSVLSILNNPMLFLDLQIILWALLGVAFSMPRLPPGHPEVQSSVVGERRGIASVPSQLINSLRLIWHDRPTELAAPEPVGRGVALAALLADVRLTVTAPPERSE